ncbi:MAG: hypothetical protein FWE05_13700, partial [Defluviitaleaceae bacterium]|nr:hypothetical protein [Defluviitaleaceae bacterium]
FLVLIDNLDNFIALCGFSKISTVEALFPKAMELGVCFVVTGNFKVFSNLANILKGSQSGLITDTPNDHHSVFSMQAIHGYMPVVDIGFLYQRGKYRKAKLPFIKEDTNGSVSEI